MTRSNTEKQDGITLLSHWLDFRMYLQDNKDRCSVAYNKYVTSHVVRAWTFIAGHNKWPGHRKSYRISQAVELHEALEGGGDDGTAASQALQRRR